jgi:hypothetical protein
VHQAATSELTREVGALMFGKHARIASTPGAAQHSSTLSFLRKIQGHPTRRR